MEDLDIGIDFGTTNSSLARADASGRVHVVPFAAGTGFTDAYRSLLYLEQVKEGNFKTVKSWSGPDGIERYLTAENKGRLIQSLKSFLSSRTPAQYRSLRPPPHSGRSYRAHRA